MEDKRKQLSWMSRGKIVRNPPRSTVFEDGVEDREQLAHAGHQSHLLRFAGRYKTLVEFLYDRVAARGYQGAHVQRRSDLGPPSPRSDGRVGCPSRGLEHLAMVLGCRST